MERVATDDDFQGQRRERGVMTQTGKGRRKSFWCNKAILQGCQGEDTEEGRRGVVSAASSICNGMGQ